MRKFPLFIAACLAPLMATPAAAQAITSTEIQDCVDNIQTGMDCLSARVTRVSVSYGLSANFELVALPLALPGEPQSLIPGINYEFTKTQPRWVYPLIYQHHVLYDPVGDFGISNPTKFAGYRIGRPRLTFDVELTITNGTQLEIYTVSPEEPVVNPRDGNPTYQGELKKIELVGSFAPTAAIPALDNFMLYIADTPDGDPLVVNYHLSMLLVPREEVSYEGRECNKVGYISRTSWGLKYGICLANQLVDKHEADLALLALDSELETKYLLSGIRAFKSSMVFVPDIQKALVYKVPEILFSDIAVTTEGLLSLRRVTNESAGIIVNAEVLFNAGPGLSNDLVLRVVIQNFGGLTADYIVEVTGCDFQIVQAIPAQARTLFPNFQATLDFPIHTKFHLESTNTCWVNLKSPTGRVYVDPKEVVFDTVPHPTPSN